MTLYVDMNKHSTVLAILSVKGSTSSHLMAAVCHSQKPLDLGGLKPYPSYFFLSATLATLPLHYDPCICAQ